MNGSFSRTALVLGDAALDRLRRAHVAVLGLGGVGGYAVEGLARAGVGELTLVDQDVVGPTNVNRQLLATTETVGLPKVSIAAQRVLSINPSCVVHPLRLRYEAATREQFFSGMNGKASDGFWTNPDDFRKSSDGSGKGPDDSWTDSDGFWTDPDEFGRAFGNTTFDYIVDAIDLVSCKLDLISSAFARNIPIISALGTGDKIDGASFEITDIARTEGCHLARVLRKELRRRGIKHHKVVYSPELPKRVPENPENAQEAPPPGRRSIPGSTPWCPAIAGLLLAQAVVLDLIKTD